MSSFNSLISYYCSSGVCFSPLHFFNLFLLLSDLAHSRSWILYLWPSFLSSSKPTYPHGLQAHSSSRVSYLSQWHHDSVKLETYKSLHLPHSLLILFTKCYLILLIWWINFNLLFCARHRVEDLMVSKNNWSLPSRSLQSSWGNRQMMKDICGLFSIYSGKQGSPWRKDI